MLCELFSKNCISTPVVNPAALTSPANNGGSQTILGKGKVAAQTPSASNDISNVARLAMESSKEKFEAIKEVQDRLFSLIAALSALLAFLGFKGVESYFTTREKATAAATETNKYKNFWKVQYPKDNRAEMAVVMGAALRDIADMYKSVMDKLAQPNPTSDKAYIDYLNTAVSHLHPAALASKSNEKLITIRALGTLGNVYYRLGLHDKALECVKDIFDKYDSKDIDSYFNAACYSCKMAENYFSVSKTSEGNNKLREALGYCKMYIGLEKNGFEASHSLNNEDDLATLRANMASEFKAVIESIGK